MDVASTTLDIPHDIQRIIFEEASSYGKDKETLLELIQAASHISPWLYRYLYQDIILPTSHSASCLVRSIQARPRGYFASYVRSLTFGAEVSHPQAKRILAELSSSIVAYNIARYELPTDAFLRYVRSPLLKRVVLVYKERSPTRSRFGASGHLGTYTEFPRPLYSGVPLAVLASLTHLALVAECPLSRTVLFPDPTPDVEGAVSFRSLVYLILEAQHWSLCLLLIPLAGSLRYIGMVDARTDIIFHSGFPSVVEENGDPRVVVVPPSGPLSNINVYGNISTYWCPSQLTTMAFWDRLEVLVKEGWLMDARDPSLAKKWSARVREEFRAAHPELCEGWVI